MVRIDREIPIATEAQIQHRMPGEQGQHVIKEGDVGLDERLATPGNVQLYHDARLFGRTANFCPSEFHLRTI